jgi:hypothetical protein
MTIAAILGGVAAVVGAVAGLVRIIKKRKAKKQAVPTTETK